MKGIDLLLWRITKGGRRGDSRISISGEPYRRANA
jgi:hypothetical protein